jgi:hypothetical protein
MLPQKTYVSLGVFLLVCHVHLVLAQATGRPPETSAPQQQIQLAIADGTIPDKTSLASTLSAEANPERVANARLLNKVSRVLDYYYDRPLNTRDHGPWSVLHWSIAYGVDAQVRVGGPRGKPVTAIGWLCSNYPAAGQRLMSRRGDNLVLPIAPGKQGHHGQFLAMLAQSRVMPDYSLRLGHDEFTIEDLVEHEQQTCRSGMELTFKLIGLAYYVKSDEEWQNAKGESWSVGRLLQEELRQPINRYASCCGGTHRLFAWHYAVHRRRCEGLPVDGPWHTADLRTRAYQRRAFQLQNRDGSFSTAWLDRRESKSDKTRRLTTSGHILEWLVFSLPDERLADPQLERAVEYVANLLEANGQKAWHRGALGHAIHALAIYERRVLGSSHVRRSQARKAASSSS